MKNHFKLLRGYDKDYEDESVVFREMNMEMQQLIDQPWTPDRHRQILDIASQYIGRLMDASARRRIQQNNLVYP